MPLFNDICSYTIEIVVKSLVCIFAVLMVEFALSSFSGSESSGEVLVTLVLLRGVSTSNITAMISLNGIDATGYL